ncbi:MAG: hypothetical protein IPK82_22390 [Polyangiaceae bacterium]|nr:hypothetical protein [Polyangiaceae bacterium]
MARRPTKKTAILERSLWTWLSAAIRRKPSGGLPLTIRAPFFALLGATMGTLLDSLHVLNGVAGYKNTTLIPIIKVAWWVPLEFATAGMVVGLLRPEFDEEFNRKRSDLPGWVVLAGMVSLVVVWGGSGLLSKAGLSNWAIAGILTPTAVVIWSLFDRTYPGAIAAVITAVIGVVVESGLVYSETYFYTKPDIFSAVPVWLPSLYLTACVAVGNLGRYLKYSWDKNGDNQF